MKITKKLIKDYLARMPRAVVHHGIDGDETYYIEKDKMLKLLIMANVNWTDLNNSSGEYRKVIFLPTKYYKRYFKSNLY